MELDFWLIGILIAPWRTEERKLEKPLEKSWSQPTPTSASQTSPFTLCVLVVVAESLALTRVLHNNSFHFFLYRLLVN